MVIRVGPNTIQQVSLKEVVNADEDRDQYRQAEIGVMQL